MEDNKCKEIAIKINWNNDVIKTKDDRIYIFKDTAQPLDGKYEDEDGAIQYFKVGKYHNENGPAIIRKGVYIAYCLNGNFHKIDGPAMILSNAEHYWYINGHEIDNKTMDNWLEDNGIPLDWKIWSNEDKMLFALHWSDYNG